MNELYTYPDNDYRLYLAHHGIKGMRWGVRRYQNYDGSLTDAGKKHMRADGKGFRARMKIRGENFVNTHRDIIRSTKEAKGLVNKASELVGHGRGETVSRNKMYAQARLKNASRTRLGKHLHDVSGYNAKSQAEYHSIKRGQNLKQRAFEAIIPVTAAKTPMKTLTGRKSTVGIETLNGFMFGLPGNIAINAAYHLSPDAKRAMDAHADVRSKESYSKAKSSYDRSMREREKNNSNKK